MDIVIKKLGKDRFIARVDDPQLPDVDGGYLTAEGKTWSEALGAIQDRINKYLTNTKNFGPFEQSNDATITTDNIDSDEEFLK